MVTGTSARASSSAATAPTGPPPATMTRLWMRCMLSAVSSIETIAFVSTKQVCIQETRCAMDDTRTGRRAPFIGRPMPRLEDLRLITGQGRYTDDFSYPGETHAAFVRSPHPHARVVGIDTVAATAMAGVLAVYT